MREFLRGDILFRGLRLALVATLATAIYLAYQYLVVQRGYVEERLGGQASGPQFALNLFGAFIALFISSTAGYAWARRGGLVGFGTWRRVKRDLVLIVPIGAVLALLTVFVLEPYLYKPLLPDVRNPFKPLNAAFAEEIICRWGILAIALRLSRSVPVAVVVSAAFNVAVALLSSYEMYAGKVHGPELVAIAAVRFLLAIGYAVFYVHRGLLSTMALHIVATLPAPILAVM